MICTRTRAQPKQNSSQEDPPDVRMGVDYLHFFHPNSNGTSCHGAIRYSDLEVRSVGSVGDFLESFIRLDFLQSVSRFLWSKLQTRKHPIPYPSMFYCLVDRNYHEYHIHPQQKEETNKKTSNPNCAVHNDFTPYIYTYNI